MAGVLERGIRDDPLIAGEGERNLSRSELESLLNNDRMTRDLGVEFMELRPERMVATMQVDKRHLQPFGYLHGGVSVVLAESVASIGAFLNCPPGKAAFGSEISASHLRPKRAGSVLTAIGTPVHAGRRSQVWQVKIEDEDGKAVCVARCTVAIVDLEA
jgi:1,4-dihydroxy-2-naphthoyl-CoA hydrolase